MMSKKSFLLIFTLLYFFPLSSYAIVKYDEGGIMVEGVQLLQDREDANAYYYLPQYPRIAQKEDKSWEILCMKYVGQGGAETNGGIFHALIEFTLPPKVIELLEAKLKEKLNNKQAYIVGPVPLQQGVKDGENGLASFQVISSILTNTTGGNPFTRTIITSGHAPFLPGSKAAISARLSQEGATLLFKSLEGNTSDVSVTLNGFYEAAVKAYNAIITAESSIVYKHFSSIYTNASGHKKEDIRKVVDDLVRSQAIKVEVFDRSAALGVNVKEMEGIVSMVTDKIIEAMFDTKTGWAQDPKRIDATEGLTPIKKQVPTEAEIIGSSVANALSFGIAGALNPRNLNPEYETDEQFILKNIKDIRTTKIVVNLSKATTIKVPVYASGNLSGLYDEVKKEGKYFKIVNLDDPDFQKREVMFQVDGEFAETFNDIFNFVTVSFKKKYTNGQEEVTKDLIFDRKTIEGGSSLQKILYPRLGISTADWLNYEYRIGWALKGDKNMINEPIAEDKWLSAKAPAILLSPPFDKRVIEIDADRLFFKEKNVVSASIRFLSIINGKPMVYKTVVLKDVDAFNTNKIALYFDKGESVAYQVTWYTKQGEERKEDVKILDQNYLLLVPKI
jgi:hypothetical protein